MKKAAVAGVLFVVVLAAATLHFQWREQYRCRACLSEKAATVSHVEVGVGVLNAALDDVARGSVRRTVGALTFEMLLHAVVAEQALPQFKNGHYREAVFNSIVAVFDFLRLRTGLQSDGMPLAQEVFSLQRPKLIVSDLATESGRNEQLGMMKMLEGAYLIGLYTASPDAKLAMTAQATSRPGCVFEPVKRMR